MKIEEPIFWMKIEKILGGIEFCFEIEGEGT
jgi:hypothetical protein